MKCAHNGCMVKANNRRTAFTNPELTRYHGTVHYCGVHIKQIERFHHDTLVQQATRLRIPVWFDPKEDNPK